MRPVELSDGALESALTRVERLIDLGESVQGSPVTVEMPRLIPLAMAASGAVEMLSELGVCPTDKLAGFRSRLERLGVERQDRTGGSRTGGQVASAPMRRVAAEHSGGGVMSVGEWQRDQVRAARRRLMPPTDQTPAVVPLATVLGSSDTVSVVLVRADVYTTGVVLSLWTYGRGEHPPFSPTHAALAERLGRPVASVPALTVTFADGRTSATVDRLQPSGVGDQREDQVVLVLDSGNGTDELLRRDHWLTPRPTAPVTLDFAWPEHGLPPRRHTIDVTGVAPPLPLWIHPTSPNDK